MITLRLTEHANIFLNTYPVAVISHLSLQLLFPYTRSQKCFTTTTIRSFSHFEHVQLPLSLYCDTRGIYSLQTANQLKILNQVLAAVAITKKSCLRIVAASMRVISAMTGNPPLRPFSTRRNFRAERHFLLFDDQLAESGGQKTKENIIPRGKFRLVENGP